MNATKRISGRGVLGVDLAAQPERTAACLIDRGEDGRGRVVDLGERAMDDEHLLELMRDPAVRKVGIDAPLGWPDEFVQALRMYSEDGQWPVALGEDEDEAQRRLVLRETDRVV